MGAIADHAAKRGHPLPGISHADAPFRPVARHGDLVFVSGQVSRRGDGVIPGPLERLRADERSEAARLALLRSLGALDAALPPDAAIVQVLKLTCYAATGDGALDPSVFNPASELLVELYGEAGRHARTVVAIAAAPFGAAVAVDLVVAVSASPAPAEPSAAP